MAVRPSGTTKYRDPSPPGTRGRAIGAAKDNQTNKSRRLSQMARRRANPRVRPVIGARLVIKPSFPPTGPALLSARVSARAPGSGSPVPAEPENSCIGARRRRTKNPPERRLGRVRDNGSEEFALRRIPSRAVRAHEPTARSRSSALGWRSDRSSRFTLRFGSIPNRSARYFIWLLASSEPAREGLPIFCNKQSAWQERHKRCPLSRLRERARVRE